MSELGMCFKADQAHDGLHERENSCVDWHLFPVPKQPIPPLLLQAYRALTSRPLTTGETIAAIEAEYPGVKEQA